MPGREYRFAEFTLKPEQRELLREGRTVQVERLPFDLLVTLVECQGQLVKREEIVARLWGPGTFQDVDASLNTAVRKLRISLRDKSDRPRFIQTVVGEGYRFVGPIETPTTPLPDAPPEQPATPAPAVQRRGAWLTAAAGLVGLSILGWVGSRGWLVRPAAPAVIAVLPFEDLGESNAEPYLSQGMTEEIITQLGRLTSTGMSVIAAPSVLPYRGKNPDVRQLAADLGVGYVVTGKVRREGSTIRVTSHLVRASDGAQLWADAFQKDRTEILALQQEVAAAVARAAGFQAAGHLPKPPARIDADAYDLYLKGRFYWNQRSESSLILAIDYFNKAIERAPDYAPAYAAIADCYSMLVYGCFLAPSDGFAKARAALAKARLIDPSSPEMLASEGYLNLYFDWDFVAAEGKLREAVRANPNYATAYDWLGVLETALERPAAARKDQERAIQLDPGSLPIATDLAFHLHYSGQNKEAVEKLRKVLLRDPNFGLAHFWMGRVLNAEGDCPAALAELDRLPALLRQWQPLIAARGYAEGVCGRADLARSDLKSMEELSKTRFVTSYGMALIEAGLGDREATLRWLRKAFEERSHWLIWIRLDPRFKAIRSDPRFQELVAKVYPASHRE